MELDYVLDIDFLRIGMAEKKFTTKSYEGSSNTNDKYFSHSSNLMRGMRTSKEPFSFSPDPGQRLSPHSSKEQLIGQGDKMEFYAFLITDNS